tara:strand:+ start:1471 stop:1911 length:441 start_codon:yes stop_codon:yes gene_type:complete
MNNRLTKFFTGLATVIFLINLMFFNNFSEDESFIEVTATFNKIDGVQKGTPVMISGVQIGSVRKISLNNNFPKVYMSLKKDLDIPDDSSISIQTDGLFGNKFLMIEIGGSENLLLTGNSFLFTEDSILVEELLEKIILIGQNKKDQ